MPGRFRIWRRVRIAPGITLNIGKRGISTSFGVRGAHVMVGRKPRATVGIPGTGVFYSVTPGRGRGTTAAARRKGPTRVPVREEVMAPEIVTCPHCNNQIRLHFQAPARSSPRVETWRDYWHRVLFGR